MKKYSIWIIIAFVIVVLAFLANFFLFQKPFLYAGTLEVTKVDLSARLAAAIESMTVQEGDKIKKGDVLVSLACEDFKSDARLADLEYERNMKLLKPGYTSQESVDTLKDK